jgi:hypothetical protein
VLDHDGSVVLAYRRRDDRGDANLIARSADGEAFTTVAVLDRDRWGAAMTGRPADHRPASSGPEPAHQKPDEPSQPPERMMDSRRLSGLPRLAPCCSAAWEDQPW